MGLNLVAVSKNYDECECCECFSELFCGYGAFWRFRDVLIKFCTNNKYNFDSLLTLTHNLMYVGDETFSVALKNDFSEEELKDKDVRLYIQGLEYIEKNYPLLYKIWAFVNHCDCDGRMDSEQLVDALPVLKLFLQYLEKNFDKDNVMIKICEELIVVFNDCIINKGILLFL